MGCNQSCEQNIKCACAPAYQTKLSHKVLRALIHFDIWVMGLLGGKDRETISAAAWNAHLNSKFFGFTHHFIDLLFRPWMKQHCRKAWEWQQELYE